MQEEFPTPQSTQEAGEEKAGLDETRARRPEPEWQRIFADLCAEIAWGSDPASETVQRLLRRCATALEAFTGGGASRAKGGRGGGT